MSTTPQPEDVSLLELQPELQLFVREDALMEHLQDSIVTEGEDRDVYHG